MKLYTIKSKFKEETYILTIEHTVDHHCIERDLNFEKESYKDEIPYFSQNKKAMEEFLNLLNEKNENKRCFCIFLVLQLFIY